MLIYLFETNTILKIGHSFESDLKVIRHSFKEIS